MNDPAAHRERGLAEAEAARRLARHGRNRLPQPERRQAGRIVLDVMREPMVLLLCGACLLYLVLGDAGEALALGVSFLFVVGLTVVQEQRSERALQALREIGAPQARVLRDGQPRVLPAEELVPGDIILLAEGDRVPADARVFEHSDLQVDESLLTGESVPVARVAGDGDESRVHASTLVVRGRGRAGVEATGAQTAVGRIGSALHAIHPGATPLQAAMRRVVALFAVASVATSLLMAWLHWWLRGDLLAALLAGITLAMATIPEEFPVVLAVFLALGAWRMARQRVLVRRAAAIETLGAVSVLCVDKTGTLTENRMDVARLLADVAPGSDQAAAQDELLAWAVLASRPDSLDPMERALRTRAAESIAPTGAVAPRHLREYPLSPERPALAHAWEGVAGVAGVAVGCKGAPEIVGRLCRLDAAGEARMAGELARLARDGLRVLGVARAALPAGGALPDDLSALPLQWLGLVAFADPLRESVPGAVAEASAAGLRVLMLTGDHARTAAAIAHQAGLADGELVVSGVELDALDDTQLDERLRDARVFARVRPEQKLRLVQSLRRSGEVVGMTGDGVNDAPALVAADVGIAMGKRGTDVAREAASIVLLDDDFASIVRAVKMGRTIHDNIRRAMRYIMAVHVPIVGLALLPLLTGAPLILMPLHVVFLELIIDPACSILFERQPPAADLMRRPPRPRGESLLPVVELLASLAQGAAVFAMVWAVHALALGPGALSHPQAAALAFASLVAGNLGLILRHAGGETLAARLQSVGMAHGLVPLAALALIAGVTLAPAPGDWFGFDPPPLRFWLPAVLVPLVLAPLLPGAPRRR